MRRASMITALLLSVGLLASACSADGEQTETPQETPAATERDYSNGFVNVTDGGEPQQGGTLSFASFSEARSLDPAAASPSGSSGATELSAIYDMLMRFNPETREIEPWLAESLEASEDFTTWTMTLRDGVTFSDGTPFTADAVVGSINHYTENRGNDAPLWRSNVANITAVDDSTVQFDLNEPWASFDTLLVRSAGLIVAPAAIAGDDFQPIGAGPFTVERHAVQEELVLAAREDYWNGRPHLDKLRFVPLTSDEMRYDSMTGGAVHMAYLRDPELVEQILDDGKPGYLRAANIGKVVLINHREGRPGSDPRVREAIALAVEPELIHERVFSGAGLPYKGVFGPTSEWHEYDAGEMSTDLERAKELVEEAKADGFDGKIVYVDVNVPAAREEALTMKSMLDRVGFEVELEYSPSVPDYVTRLYADGDFDVSKSSMSITDEEPYLRFHTALSANSPSNATGYADEEMEQHLADLKRAVTTEEKGEAIRAITERFYESIAAIPVSPTINILVMQDNVHGVVPTADAIMFFSEAWLSE